MVHTSFVSRVRLGARGRGVGLAYALIWRHLASGLADNALPIAPMDEWTDPKGQSGSSAGAERR